MVQPVGNNLHVVVDNSAFVQQVTGTVAVDNFPATQPVTGTVSVSNLPATQAVSAVSLPLPADAATASNQTNGLQQTKITNFPATQTVVGTITAVPGDPTVATYSAATLLIPAATALVVFTITGSATKTVRVWEVSVTGTRTTGTANNLLLQSIVGTISAGTVVAPAQHDYSDPVPTAVVQSYTANPTLTLIAVGVLKAQKEFMNATSGSSELVEWRFGEGNRKPVVLRGTSQILAVNLDFSTVTGGSLACSITWTET